MDRFGMDLGTTNSALCFFNEVSDGYEFLKIGNQSRDFFPTVIAYNKQTGEIIIGEKAQKVQFKKKYDVYSLFKLSLGEHAHDKNGRERSPYEVTRDFLGKAIEAFTGYSGCARVNNLVLTVPDVWKNEEKNKVAVDNLMQIFEDLGMDSESQVELESEPVSAVAYYCRKLCKEPYNGYAIVVDYGGGTLDLTLCKVEDGQNITVLRRCGDGGTGAMGCAGVAFDNALTSHLVKKYQLDPEDYAQGTNRFSELRSAVEDAKIDGAEHTRAVLKDYYEAIDPYTNESLDDNPAFDVLFDDEDVDEITVMASDIAATFEQVNAPALKQALDTMKGFCKDLDINLDSQEHLRILMVGGFSNLYCVEKTCRENLCSQVGAQDQRFDESMRVAGRPSIAIAHGAAIIAQGAAKVDYQCQNDVGFFYYDVEEEKEMPLAVICRDTPVKEYKQPKYVDDWFDFQYDAQNLQLRLFFNDGKGIVPVVMDESFRELCGDAFEEGNAYQIGFSMGKHRIPMIHIRDKKGRENSVSLNRVLSKIALRKVKKPEKQEETV